MTYKVLIHMGLPKTATTSLQSNVLLELHKQGKLNFLGRVGTPAYKVSHNPAGAIFDEAMRSKTSPERLTELREQLEAQLSETQINVYSEEVIPIDITPKVSVSYENLKVLLQNCDVQGLLVLRNPRDFIFSYYVELYRWHYARTPLNSFEKFVDDVCSYPEKKEYDILFFDRLIQRIKAGGIPVDIMLYEDLINDKSIFFKGLSYLLQQPQDTIEELFQSRVQNARKKKKGGKFGQAITLDQYFQWAVLKVRKKLKMKPSKVGGLRYKIFWRMMSFLMRIEVAKAKEHVISEQALNKYMDLCQKQNKYAYITNTTKRHDYGYSQVAK